MSPKNETFDKDKALRLFSYIEKVLAVDLEVIRDYKKLIEPPYSWSFVDFPAESNNLIYRRIVKEDSPPEYDDSTILKVRKIDLKSPPALPDHLVDWFKGVRIVSDVIPTPLDKINRIVYLSSMPEIQNEFEIFLSNYTVDSDIPGNLKDWVTVTPGETPNVQEYIFVPDYWSDHPELIKVLDVYISDFWKLWSESYKEDLKVNKMYDELFALNMFLKNSKDSFELLFTQGLITWKHNELGIIQSPLFFVPIELSFDPQTRALSVTIEEPIKSFVEINAFSDINGIDYDNINRWMSTINSLPFDFWHFKTLKSQINIFINSLSPESKDSFTENYSSEIEFYEYPAAWNYPQIILRKRSASIWSEYANLIKSDILNSDSLNVGFIKDLIGDYSETNEDVSYNERLGGGVFDTKNSELFFPLPYNAEQMEIAEKIEVSYGVVVKGPPGTGKSHTIANLISRFLAQGKSVLVTSQTSKALEVLRDKIPQDIRSLVVSQVNTNLGSVDTLKQSISEISANLGSRRTKFSDEILESKRKLLKTTREEKARVTNKIRDRVLQDSVENFELDGTLYTPISAAKFISENKIPNTLWFVDKVPVNAELNFSFEDLQLFFETLKKLDIDDMELYKYELPNSEDLYSFDHIESLFTKVNSLDRLVSKGKGLYFDLSNKYNKSAIESIFFDIESALKILDIIDEPYERELFSITLKNENLRKGWFDVTKNIRESLEKIRESKSIILGHNIYIRESLPQSINNVYSVVKQIHNFFEDGNRLSFITKLRMSKDFKYILDNVLVDDLPITNSFQSTLLFHHFRILFLKYKIDLIFKQKFDELKNPPLLEEPTANIFVLENLLDNIDLIISCNDKFEKINKFIIDNIQFSEYNFNDKDHLNLINYSLKYSKNILDLESLSNTLEEMESNLKQVQGRLNSPDLIINEFINAIKERNINKWLVTLDTHKNLKYKISLSKTVNELGLKISKYCPLLVNYLVKISRVEQRLNFENNLNLVWRLSRIESWLTKFENLESLESLQVKQERLINQENKINTEIISIVAWQNLIDRVTNRERQALEAWGLAVKQLGSGRGKYANKYLQEAQKALKDAKGAVPVWIMPLTKVAQMFPEPKAGMFDIVIFDEASQCDIRGLNIAYLGKKILVVGDPDQISPAGLFINQEKIFESMERFLHDVPFKNTFSIKSSLFKMAEVRIKNKVQLNEHFRCVPDIISFSNHYIYEGKLKPLRYPNPNGSLLPALNPIYIENGYLETNRKINIPEAEALVNKLVECIKSPKYDLRPNGEKCTFGVISLSGEDQAKYIQQLIMRHPEINEKIIVERQIVSGNAYAFQGDERDVILISMVNALDSENISDTIRAETKDITSQIFNVAATRARDQVFLFHSIPLSSLKNPKDWKYRLLNWYYNPKSEEIEAGRKALEKEFKKGNASEFSVEVGKLILDRGYQVIPEFPVIGYRIDLVVQGENTRLAVECDGDQYHTLDNWEQDQIREEQLRRAGWVFWRITGSSFYRNKEKSLDSLWKKLDEMGIKPLY